MSYNYSKLKGKIIEVYGTFGSFSEMMGWSKRTNSLKLNGIREWKQSEIVTASELLGIKSEEIELYFFDVEVQDIEQTN